jgi:hypothetical protein
MSWTRTISPLARIRSTSPKLGLAGLKSAENQSLGTATVDLVSVGPSFKAETHKGHKMDARGLLYKEPGFTELNLTSLTMVSSSCGK